jgi:hypothetical protein
MTHQDQDKQRQHWQAIAEQLGLDSSTGEPRPGHERPSPVRQQAEESPGAGKPEPPDRPADTQEAGLAPEEPSEVKEPKSAALGLEPEKAPEEETEATGQRERRGRRGGRRSAKSQADDLEASEGAAETGRRRKSTRVRKKDAGDQPAEVSPEGSPATDADEDEGDFEDFSDWSVPSWNELIASLYRPSR